MLLPVKASAASVNPARFMVCELFSSLKYWSPLLSCVRKGSRFFAVLSEGLVFDF